MRRRIFRQLRLARQFSAKTKDKNYTSEYYENIVSGVVTRNHYEASTNRSDAEVGSLGRIYLYQYHCCPYCNKVKAVLDYYQIPYTIVEVHPIKKKELPDRRVFFHHKLVPVLMVNPAQAALWGKAKVLYDSNKIIRILISHFVSMGKVHPADYERATSPLVQVWTEWMDAKLIPHLFTVVSHSTEEQMQYFRYLEEFPKFFKAGIGNKVIGPICMNIFSKQVQEIKEMHGIRNGEEIEICTEVLREWNEITNNSFHGGAMPDLADLQCYGILRTFNRVSMFDEMLTKSGVKEWYEATEYVLGESSCVTHF